MKLSPGQIAELRSDANVRGALQVDGMLATVYRVSVGYQAFERGQVLTNSGSAPPNLLWYVHTSNPQRVEIHTSMPEWWVELEEMINDARRPSPR